jgi:hypothetical protein
MRTSSSYLVDAERSHRARRRYVFLASWAVVITCALWGVVWIMSWSPAVRISRIDVSGSVHVSADRVIDFVRGIVFRDSPFVFMTGPRNILVWPEEISHTDIGNFLELESIRIEKDWLRRVITIHIKERVPVGIWCLEKSGGPNCFWFDETGFLFGPSPLVEGSLLMVLHDHFQEKQNMGRKILPQRFIDNMFSVFRALREAAVPVAKVSLYDLGLQEVVATTYGGVDIYFSLRFSSEYTAPILNSFITGDGDKIPANVKMIDFRTERRLFYK